MSNNIQNISKSDDTLSLEELNLLLKKKNKSIPTKFLYDDIGSKLLKKLATQRILFN